MPSRLSFVGGEARIDARCSEIEAREIWVKNFFEHRDSIDYSNRAKIFYHSHCGQLKGAKQS